MESLAVKQECCSCGESFTIEYYENGWYDYLDTPCECESDFTPIDGKPSFSDWLEYLTY